MDKLDALDSLNSILKAKVRIKLDEDEDRDHLFIKVFIILTSKRKLRNCHFHDITELLFSLNFEYSV